MMAASRAVAIGIVLACLSAPDLAAQVPGFEGLAATTDRQEPAKRIASVQFDLGLELSVRLRNWKCDSDLLAGGKLLMEGRPDGKGGMQLWLVRPLEHPWKFFWVNAIGVQQQVKCGLEVTLEAGSWEARKKADEAAARIGQAAYERWKREWGGKRGYDGSYAFYVIGDPRGRLTASAGPGGRIDGVANRLTHRWLPRGFDDWLAGKPGEGYGFWAQDAKPPDWEPHCYHGLIAALKLLEIDGFQGSSAEKTAALGKGATYTRQHWGVPQVAAAVLSTLVPRAAGQLEGSGNPVLRYSVTDVSDDSMAVAGTSGAQAVEKGGGVQYTVDHVLRYDRENRHLTHQTYSVHLRKGDNPELKLKLTLSPHR